MSSPRFNVLHVVALAGGLAACNANIHDNTVNIDATVKVTTSVDVKNVMPGQVVPCSATATNVFLIDPSMTPPVEHAADAGHFQYYLDDDTAPPLLITAQTTVDIKIPVDTKAGDHKILCRIHKHDGTPTNAMFELKITVTVTVSTGDGGH
jgi:hypothetical protein